MSAVLGMIRKRTNESQAPAQPVRPSDINSSSRSICTSVDVITEAWKLIKAAPSRTTHAWVHMPLFLLTRKPKKAFMLQFISSTDILRSSGPEEDETIFTVRCRFLDADGNAIPLQSGEGHLDLRTFSGSEERKATFRLPIVEGAESIQISFYVPNAFCGETRFKKFHIICDQEVGTLSGARIAWAPIDFSKTWHQKGRKVFVKSFYGTHWAEMPKGWRLKKVHPAALKIAESYLFNNMECTTFGLLRDNPWDFDFSKSRKPGNSLLLSFSAGADSTAALALLPKDTIKFLSKRGNDHIYLFNGKRYIYPKKSALDSCIDSYDDVVIVEQTFDEIPIGIGLTVGIKDPTGYAVYGVLMADYFNAGALAFGSVMEQCFMRSGNRFSDSIKHERSGMNRIKKILSYAGLNFTMPTAGLSEVVTDRISLRYPSISCGNTDENGVPCGTCFKCFRKMRLMSSDVPEPRQSVIDILKKYPLKSATSVIYACQKSGWSCPEIERYLGADLGFLERYFGKSMDYFVPEQYRAHVKGALAEHGIDPMSEEDEQRLRQVARIFLPEEFSLDLANVQE